MGHKGTRPKLQRLQIAKQWIPTYTGDNIVKGYKKKFAVDLLTAIRDLQESGVSLSPEYISAVKKEEEQRKIVLQRKKLERLSENENDSSIIKRVGKNHIRVNGSFLQTNKKWSHLKQKQRDFIYEITSDVYLKYVDEYKHLPIKNIKEKIIEAVMDKVQERKIWLPSYELERNVSKYIDRLNRKINKIINLKTERDSI
jgi:hypothetical protein